MEPLILYFIKVNVALAVLYVFYRLAFSKDTFFGLRRLILILIYITSFAYPFFSFDAWTVVNPQSPTVQVVSTFYQMMLPEVIVTGATTGNAAVPWARVGIILLYTLGAGLLLMRTLLELWSIYKSLRRYPATVIQGIRVWLVPGEQEPYSFFRWIFLHPQLHTEKEVGEILIHEQTHVQEWHSADILLSQAIIILCWFNPFAWMMRSEIRMNHEYLADRRVVNSGCDKKAYQYHLIGLKHTSLAAANLYNNFSILPLKKRIKMLNKKRTRNIMKSKYLMFIPVAALLMIFSNCTNAKKGDASQQDAATEVIDSTKIAPVVQAEPDFPGVSPNAQVVPEEKVYEVTEVAPQFPDGTPALMKYLSKAIKYPTDAIENGVQGRVIVQFIVNADGTIYDPKIVKSVSESLDKEALRVIRAMPTWSPGKDKGKAVRVKFTVPVMFKLQ